MSLLELVKKRKSVRHFLDMKVEKEKIDYIMECARHAPSAVNFQPCYYYIIESDESKALVQKCYGRRWFSSTNIPVYILACVDTNASWKRSYDQKDHGDIDVAIAVEHICLAAAEMDLGSCWVCDFDPVLCKELFSLPDNLEPAVIIPLGYPTNEEKSRTPRKLLSEISEVI